MKKAMLFLLAGMFSMSLMAQNQETTKKTEKKKECH